MLDGKIILALGLALGLAPAADAADRMFRVSYSAPATAYLPLWAAKDAGFFEKNNLKVEMLYVGSSPIALAANPRAREIPAAALIYNRPADEVGRSGIIEQLYR
jgi:ABC-type nitrate/sulfonate/bicarbonate transport system substrate-binding protein